MTESVSPFEVPEEEVEQLRWRLRSTRWPVRWPMTGWAAGTDPGELHRLVEYWISGYDWRVHEAAINALPSHFADLHDARIHYLKFDAEISNAKPIVLTHGWPSSFLELVGLARRLARPSEHGGEGSDAFTVIVPSLPGFAFSAQQASLLEGRPISELWHALMRNELGFERYAAHGGDLGAGVTSYLGQDHPDALIGIHLLAVADPVDVDAETVTEEERAYLDSVTAWHREEGAYEHQQQTRPITLSYGLSDSPVGLLAWLLEKYHAWSDDKSKFSDDFLLTQASLYWFTNTISTSFRPYYEYGRKRTAPIVRVRVPTALAVFPADLSHPPRSWAERTYNLTRYNRMPQGGHFAAYEEPELLSHDITEFFRDLT